MKTMTVEDKFIEKIKWSIVVESDRLGFVRDCLNEMLKEFISLSKHNEEIEALREKANYFEFQLLPALIKTHNEEIEIHRELLIEKQKEIRIFKKKLLYLKAKYKKGCGVKFVPLTEGYNTPELYICGKTGICPSCKAKLSAIKEAMK